MEAWLSGAIPGIPPYLMPAAHALVQALEDVERATARLSDDELWARPGGAASIGFHIRHIAGVLDRLLTYARGETLSREQFARLKAEGDPGNPVAGVDELLSQLQQTVDQAIAQIRGTSSDTLLDPREVGRKKAPSNVHGLIFHAAEHAQRHTGQIIATAKFVRK